MEITVLEPGRKKLRNIKFRVRKIFHSNRFHTLREIIPLIDGIVVGNINTNEEVSFIGFFNEFNDINGSNCLYFLLDNKKELVEDAIKHGAVAVVSEYELEGTSYIKVSNIWDALKKVSGLYYGQFKGISSVVIAGSIGKTTTKEMTFEVFRKSRKAFSTPNNGNVFRYIAYEIQHMPYNTEVFVQEVDESYPDNAHNASILLKPHVAIITTIDKSHIGVLGSEEAVSNSILAVTDGMDKTDHVIVNLEDSKSSTVEYIPKAHTISIKNKEADCFADNIKSFSNRIEFDIVCNEYKSNGHVTLNCVGVHNVYNAMFAYMAGKIYGIPDKSIIAGLRKYRPMTIRQKVYKWMGKTIYADCYNASAKSVRAALKAVDTLVTGKKGRMIAILGDIAEIEGYEEDTYSLVAKALDKSNVNVLYTFGDTSSLIWDYVTRKFQGQHVESRDELLRILKKEVVSGDVVLLKASHSMAFEGLLKRAYPIAFVLGRLHYWKELLGYILQTV